ncbi:hypothetical protein BU26DRAFT_519500 [Trematosphaeria pertusa]|uniref:Uncharacterized protein n=1 Tax=Trematosphaeria pertusa TaxID=390896 RepID=A0A6A6IFS8_9PLEO|nr:uncharacterized protein BU26DRAFT_519500 [Trematosphaeria pertusa]KAF2249434.1 hypothetical protein BU26DRAFT_519500 [Trematosphaeria pertusa]
MVLYHDDGRVVKAHEDYLERAAKMHSEACGFEGQTDALQRQRPEVSQRSADRVQFRIHPQDHWTLYSRVQEDRPWFDGYRLQGYLEESHEPTRLPEEGVHKATLMKCSGYAQEYFMRKPDSKELSLPIRFPRRHDYGSKKYYEKYETQMAYITPAPLEDSIIPWLEKVEEYLAEDRHKGEIPKPNIPDSLLDKIYLYGAMLQLSVPRFIQEPLIEALCKEMYKRPLKRCHLEALELSVARLHAYTVPTLDPVLNHVVGTYGLRSRADRDNPGSAPTGTDRPMSAAVQPRFLEYTNTPAGRADFPADTYIVPPRLAVLGHCIRHWSGVRYDGSTAAAYTGYPLNVGIVNRPVRRGPGDDLHLDKKNAKSSYYLRGVCSFPGEGKIEYAPRKTQSAPSAPPAVKKPTEESNK